MSAVGKRYGVPVLAVLAVLLATATESGSHAFAAVEARKISGFVGRSIAQPTGPASVSARNAPSWCQVCQAYLYLPYI